MEAPNGNDNICDGQDNDCDGSVDEGYQGNSTTCGIGACQRNGAYICVNAQEIDNCQPGQANIEIANNGIDEDCNGQDLSYSWQTSAWGVCDANATWSTGAWSSCSAVCGSGNQTRTVSCTSDTGSETRNVSCVDNYGKTVADNLCSGNKPTSTRSCTDTNCDQAQPSSSRSCSEYSYSWSTGAWSACDANATYTTSAWGGCSTSCGSGTQSRTVSCQSDTGTETRSANCLRCDGQSVDSSLCGSSPSTSRSCTDSTCSGAAPSATRACEEYTYNLSIGAWGSCSANATWSTGAWGACSSTCEGTQSRSVTCNSDTGTESRTVSCTRCDGAAVAQSACGTNYSTSRACTDTSCDGPQPANSQPCSGGQCPCAFASYGPSGAVCSGGPANHGQTMGTCSEGGTCSATCNNGTWQANHYGCFANPTYSWSEIQAFNYGLLDDPFSCVEPLPRTPMCTSGAGSACSSSGAKCKEWLECSDGAYYVMGRICQ